MRVTKLGFLLALLTAGVAVADLPPGARSAASGDGPAAATAASPAHPEILGLSDAADSPLAALTYYYVLGAQLQPRTSTTVVTYDGVGCIHLASGTDNRLMFPLLLPEGSVIKFFRIYFDDTNTVENLDAWLTSYEAGTTSTDLVTLSSSGSAGYGTVLSPILTIPFDSVLNYTLIVAPNVNDSTVQICGVRVAYYAPLLFRDGFESGGTAFWSAVAP